MYCDDHAPAHFHAYYGDHRAQISIESLDVIGGSLPKRVLALAVEWAVEHRDELRADWERAAEHQPLLSIDPLE
ncbi:MAG: DUF4160 domain-containing protein [Myxococcaceae bacterium]|nr:DUF4160 domain-containing protein [Myxococcaceae bacterium]